MMYIVTYFGKVGVSMMLIILIDCFFLSPILSNRSSIDVNTQCIFNGINNYRILLLNCEENVAKRYVRSRYRAKRTLFRLF